MQGAKTMNNETKVAEKTHWLQNPNKHYLGHWDIPNGEDVILTVASAQWEKVENPTTQSEEAKRVIRFMEKDPWVKPLICNQINAQNILKSTKEKFMEDCVGKKLKISIGQTKVKGEEVDCLRVKNIPQSSLIPDPISSDQMRTLHNKINEANKALKTAGKDPIEFCKAMKISSLGELPESKLQSSLSLLEGRINENS